jgi:hypothetical protein
MSSSLEAGDQSLDLRLLRTIVGQWRRWRDAPSHVRGRPYSVKVSGATGLKKRLSPAGLVGFCGQARVRCGDHRDGLGLEPRRDRRPRLRGRLTFTGDVGAQPLLLLPPARCVDVESRAISPRRCRAGSPRPLRVRCCRSTEDMTGSARCRRRTRAPRRNARSAAMLRQSIAPQCDPAQAS